MQRHLQQTQPTCCEGFALCLLLADLSLQARHLLLQRSNLAAQLCCLRRSCLQLLTQLAFCGRHSS
jgi:hypothetical protein